MSREKQQQNYAIWIIRVILIVLIVFWMYTIFGFSADSGEESQSLSDKITIKVVEILKPDYDSLARDKQEEFFEKVSFCVRKIGHFGEYGILGILIGCLLVTFEKIRKLRRYGIKMAIITAVVCMIYASTDEYHQGFVEGRSPMVMDVVIDTLGGLCGAIMVCIAAFLIIRHKRDKGEENEVVGTEY